MGMSQLDRNPEPLPYKPRSSSLQCVEDLVNSLDTGEPPRGGKHGKVPRDNMELIYGFVESFARGGDKVHFPLVDHGRWRFSIGDETLLAPDRRLPSFERRVANAEADAATDEQLAEAAGALVTAEAARL
jgi:hypothetical protein